VLRTVCLPEKYVPGCHHDVGRSLASSIDDTRDDEFIAAALSVKLDRVDHHIFLGSYCTALALTVVVFAVGDTSAVGSESTKLLTLDHREQASSDVFFW